MSCYVISKGYRFVLPYLYTAKLKVKDDGVKTKEVLLKYLPPRKTLAVEEAVSGGRVWCNAQQVESPDHVMHKNDVLSYTLHWHETEVLAGDMDVLHWSDEVVVVNKLSSIPVHPAGNFRMNTVQNILRHEQGASNLTSVHRIDRLASGVLIFGCTPAALSKLCTQFQRQAVSKEYLARVKGTFPEGVIEVKKPIARLQDYPILYTTSPEGKPSHTVFERESVSRDGSESLVRCKPITGRTHQIRVHLKWLGHPIANDCKYGGDLALSHSAAELAPELQDYTKVDWCSECASGHRDKSFVSREDRLATHIWLHALRYSNPHPKHGWSFEAPPPAWSLLS